MPSGGAAGVTVTEPGTPPPLVVLPENDEVATPGAAVGTIACWKTNANVDGAPTSRTDCPNTIDGSGSSVRSKSRIWNPSSAHTVGEHVQLQSTTCPMVVPVESTTCVIGTGSVWVYPIVSS